MTRARASAGWLAQRLGRLLASVVAVRWAVEVVGELVVSVVLASVILVWGLGRWAALERRLDRRPGRVRGPVVVARGPGRVDEAGEHVAFARGLVAVSARYLAHCEEQADEDMATREGWR